MEIFIKIANNSEFYYQSTDWGILETNSQEYPFCYTKFSSGYTNSYRTKDIKYDVLVDTMVESSFNFRIHYTNMLLKNHEPFLL